MRLREWKRPFEADTPWIKPIDWRTRISTCSPIFDVFRIVYPMAYQLERRVGLRLRPSSGPSTGVQDRETPEMVVVDTPGESLGRLPQQIRRRAAKDKELGFVPSGVNIPHFASSDCCVNV